MSMLQVWNHMAMDNADSPLDMKRMLTKAEAAKNAAAIAATTPAPSPCQLSGRKSKEFVERFAYAAQHLDATILQSLRQQKRSTCIDGLPIMRG